MLYSGFKFALPGKKENASFELLNGITFSIAQSLLRSVKQGFYRFERKTTCVITKKASYQQF